MFQRKNELLKKELDSLNIYNSMLRLTVNLNNLPLFHEKIIVFITDLCNIMGNAGRKSYKNVPMSRKTCLLFFKILTILCST